MGWGRTLLLGNIGAQLNIDDLGADVNDVKQHLEMQRHKDGSLGSGDHKASAGEP